LNGISVALDFLEDRLLKSAELDQITFYLSHAPSLTGVDVTGLTYKPLTNKAVQEIELRKYLLNKI
jgi:hypothetical protein